MPDHASQRIAQLPSLVQQGLHQQNLDRLVQGCNALAQDTSHVLFFFVLKSVFQEMSDAPERGPVDVSRYQELVSRIGEQVCALLQTVGAGNPIGSEQIEELVRTHLVNLSLFRS